MKKLTGTVEVGVGTKKFSRPVTYREIESAEDILELLQDPKTAKEAIDNWNYAENLNARAPVRAAILANEAAAASAEEKQIKDLIKVRAAAGKPITEDQARKLIEMLKSVEV
jgi:hypothetical protein